MSNMSVTTKIIQKLSNNSGSVIPIAAKDTLSNCAITYIYNQQASKEDGRERAIEEFGTEVLWIGGIPFLKKLFDKTVYKLFKANPNFDIRNLKKNSEGKLEKLELLVKNTKDAGQKQFLENVLKNENVQKLYKRLHVAKFITATAATLAGLSGLIIYKQKTTQKELEEKYKKKMELANACNKEIKKSPVFNMFQGRGAETSFKGGGAAKFLSGFMYNPVMNMSILDAGITGTRLALGREGERFEIGFKEGFQILFIYCLANPIQKGLEWASEKFLKTPIKNEYQLLSDKNLANLLQDENLEQSIKTLLNADDKGVLEYIFENDNSLTKMLKISGEIPTLKDKTTINSLADIDTGVIKKGVKNIDELLKGFSDYKGKDLAAYLSKAKNIKGVSVIANILIGAAAIGIFQPMANIIMRKKQNNGESINPAIKKLEKDMEQKFAFSGTSPAKPQ